MGIQGWPPSPHNANPGSFCRWTVFFLLGIFVGNMDARGGVGPLNSRALLTFSDPKLIKNSWSSRDSILQTTSVVSNLQLHALTIGRFGFLMSFWPRSPGMPACFSRGSLDEEAWSSQPPQMHAACASHARKGFCLLLVGDQLVQFGRVVILAFWKVSWSVVFCRLRPQWSAWKMPSSHKPCQMPQQYVESTLSPQNVGSLCHFWANHSKVPSCLQRIMHHSIHTVSRQGHPQHERTKALLPQWTKCGIHLKGRWIKPTVVSPVRGFRSGKTPLIVRHWKWSFHPHALHNLVVEKLSVLLPCLWFKNLHQRY